MHNGIMAQNDAMVKAADSVNAPAICHEGRCSLAANLTITKGIAMFTNGRKFMSGVSTFAHASKEYDSDMPAIRHSTTASTCK